MDTKEPATPAAASAKAERVAEGAEPPPIALLFVDDRKRAQGARKGSGLVCGVVSVIGRLWTGGAPWVVLRVVDLWALGMGLQICKSGHYHSLAFGQIPKAVTPDARRTTAQTL